MIFYVLVIMIDIVFTITEKYAIVVGRDNDMTILSILKLF